MTSGLSFRDQLAALVAQERARNPLADITPIMVDVADELDLPTTDLEPDADLEPDDNGIADEEGLWEQHGGDGENATEIINQERAWRRTHAIEDGEPTLGSAGCYNGTDHLHGWNTATPLKSDECEREDEHGTDLDQGELDESDGEPSIGATEGVNQEKSWAGATYGYNGEPEYTATERHGKGFVRSGPDDAEDDDPAEDSDPDHGIEDEPHDAEAGL